MVRRFSPKLLSRWCKFRNAATAALFFTVCATAMPDCAVNKNSGINFQRALNKKWQTVSQAVVPAWVNPATGKTYAELADFAKEFIPCVTDDYVTYDGNGGTAVFHNALRCFPNQPEKEVGTYAFYKGTDSLVLMVPIGAPGQTVNTTIRCKVIRLLDDEMVLRYNQVLPSTRTQHTITETYKRIP